MAVRSEEVDSNVFLQGDRLSLGIGTTGSFGTSVDAPDGFYTDSGVFDSETEEELPRLGIYGDLDGFETGEDPGFKDVTVPGIPEERFNVGYRLAPEGEAIVYTNSDLEPQHGTPLPTVAVEDLSTEEELKASWEGADENLELVQVVSFDPENSYAEVTVTLTNKSDQTIYDVRYMRNVDPDHPLDGDGITTENHVHLQSPGEVLVAAYVPATSPEESGSEEVEAAAAAPEGTTPFFYFSTDPRAVVANFGFTNTDPYAPEVTSDVRREGYSTLTDSGIAIAFDVGELAPGESTTLTFYLGVTDDLEETIEEIDPNDAPQAEPDFYGATPDGALEDPQSGHSYLLNDYPLTWDEARADAEAKGGHLVTLTTFAENTFVYENLIQPIEEEETGDDDDDDDDDSWQAWIGASDAAVEGEWRWVTGPEAGFLFWQGDDGGTAFGFANWEEGQPDDWRFEDGSGPGEDYAQFWPGGSWNDSLGGPDDLRYSVVEFSPPHEDATTAIAKSFLLANDAEDDWNLVVEPVGDSALGADVQSDEGYIYYDPSGSAAIQALDDGESVEDTFTYQVSDGEFTDTATVTVKVWGRNDAPTAPAGNSVTTSEDTPAGGVAIGASDVDGEQLSYSLKPGAAPSKGTVTFDQSDGVFFYTPNANANGPDTFTIVVSDGVSTTEQVVSVNITPVNDAPAAPAGNVVNTSEDTPAGGVAIGASDVDGNALSYSVKPGAAPSKGTVIFDQSDGVFFYTPNANANGADSFTILISDGQGGTTEQAVSVNITPVNDAPVAANDTLSNVAEDSGTRTIAGATLTGNDSKGPENESGQALTVIAVSNVAGGTATVSNGNVLFTPTANYNGPASFTYTVQDNGTTNGSADPKSSTATASFNVTSVNDAPVAPASRSVPTGEDTPSSAFAIGASDVDGNALSYGVKPGAEPTKGTVSFNQAAGTFVYTPSPNANGADSFTILISDGQGGTAQQTVSVNIAPVNDAPTAPASRSISTNEDAASAAVTIDAIDVDGDTLSYGVKAGAEPTKGVVTFDQAAGTFVYTPNANANGADSFTIVIFDSQGGATEQVVSVDITPLNDAPVAGNDSAVVTEGTTISGNVIAGANGAGQDTDLEGDQLAVRSVVVQGSNAAPTRTGAAVTGTFGTLVLQADGSYSYTTTNTSTLTSGEVGTDTFVYTLGDATDGVTTATLTFSVIGQDVVISGGSGLLFGQDGDDRIAGNNSANQIRGLDGDDILEGSGGDDQIWGDAGNDTLSGGDGADEVVGGEGDDTISLGDGNDTAWGEEGDDTISGGDGNDVIVAGSGDDTVSGGDGVEVVFGEEGNDEIDLGDGSDFVWADEGNDSVDGGSGDDQMVGGSGNDNLSGGSGDDRMWGETGDDVLDGGSGDDLYAGGPDEDILTFGSGDDTAWGGLGPDSFVFIDGFDDVTIQDFNGTDEIVLDGIFSSFSQVQNAMEQVGDDVVISAPGSASITLANVDIGSLNGDDFSF